MQLVCKHCTCGDHALWRAAWGMESPCLAYGPWAQAVLVSMAAAMFYTVMSVCTALYDSARVLCTVHQGHASHATAWGSFSVHMCISKHAAHCTTVLASLTDFTYFVPHRAAAAAVLSAAL